VPITGQAWIGIVPSDRVIGLSKFHRLTDWIMSRPQIQEEATAQLADVLETAIAPPARRHRPRPPSVPRLAGRARRTVVDDDLDHARDLQRRSACAVGIHGTDHRHGIRLMVQFLRGR
jgi:hypothetical protein